jgi:choline dehydrogenase-like flavoprotein
MARRVFDYVVGGGGTAGCLIAKRLSQKVGNDVLVAAAVR